MNKLPPWPEDGDNTKLSLESLLIYERARADAAMARLKRLHAFMVGVRKGDALCGEWSPVTKFLTLGEEIDATLAEIGELPDA